MTRLKTSVFSLILLLLGLITGLLGGEILVRLFVPQKCVSPCLTYNFNQYFVGKEDCTFRDSLFGVYNYHVSTNELGLRMEKLQLEKDAILRIGDSYTFGWGTGLEKSYFGLLSKKIVDSTTQSQLINGAVPGYSTGHACEKMERLAEILPFKKVIYFMCSNDIFDNIRTEDYYQNYEYSMDEKGKVHLKKKRVYSSFRRFLFKYTPYEKITIHSQLFHFIRGFFRKKMPDYNGKEATSTLLNTNFLTKVSMAHLRNLYTKCQTLNVDLMVVWIPAPEELLLRGKDKWDKGYDYNQFKMLAKNYLEQRSENFVDPLEKMNNKLSMKNADLTDYFIPDQHFNAAGYELFYETVEEEVFQFAR
jgi:lysophospholipase L1-like esterase